MTVEIDAKELAKVERKLKQLAKETRRAGLVLEAGKPDITILNRAYKNIRKDVQKPLKNLAKSAAPTATRASLAWERRNRGGGSVNRLKKASAYQVKVFKGRESRRAGGKPPYLKLKAGQFKKKTGQEVSTPTSTAYHVGRFSGYVHHGTKPRQDRGSIQPNPWLYRVQAQMLPTVEKSYRKRVEQSLQQLFDKTGIGTKDDARNTAALLTFK